MKATRLKISAVILIEPEIFKDERGFFFASFNSNDFEEATGVSIDFVQDNHSKSIKGVLRGLHYQLPPKAQGKLVRVIQGKVFDVAVDIRKSSPTFSHWIGEILSAENKKQLWIPEGFAHGFISISASTELLYKTSDYYAPLYERCISWKDRTIAIDWKFDGTPILSKKDAQALDLEKAELFE